MKGCAASPFVSAAWALVLALAVVLGACSQGSLDNAIGSGGKLEKPAKVFIGVFDMKRDVSILDPGLEQQLKSRMSGLTEAAARIETGRRVEQIFMEQLLASLRAAGLPAEIGSQDSMLANMNAVIVYGALNNLDEDARRQRRVPAIGRSNIRIVAETKVIYYADIKPRPLFDFTAEDTGGPTPTARASVPPRSGPAASALPAATQAARLSPDVEAHVRRVGQAVAARIAAYAAEQGWVAAAPTAAAAPRRL